ncbi:flagellar basal body P-ring formation chaperone FlgA [Afipia sp. TerB]
MTIRPLLIAIALLASGASALAQEQDRSSVPVLRASVSVSSDVVRIGDLVDNAGAAAQIAVYRAPDLGTTGSVPVAQIIESLRAHDVIGVDTRDLREVSVTRLSRVLSHKDVEHQVARALERRNGLGDAADLAITFDRSFGDLQLDAANSGDLKPQTVRFDSRSGRFDVTFEIVSPSSAQGRLRLTGIAVETVEAVVLTRSLDRNDIIKASDVVIERRPKAEVGNAPAPRDQTIGMQARRPLRTGQALKVTDLAKADLVTRDQNVTLIYQVPGIYLTGRGKALEAGTEGDTINVTSLQSKRIVQGRVIGPGQVAILVARPQVTASLAANAPAPSISVAENSKVE